MKATRWFLWITVLLAAGLLVFGATACGGDDDEAEDTTATAAAEEEFLAGVVSDVGRFNDRGFNQLSLEGCQKAEDEMGVTCKGIESKSTSDYVPNFASLSRDDAGIAVATGFLLAEATNAAAGRFPDLKFAIVDYSAKDPPFGGKKTNVLGLTFETNENSYMIGCLAALTAKRQGGQQVISAVGGIKIPTVDIFIAGYQAGAKKCNPAVKVLIGYSQDFVAQDKCKEIALNQIAQGSQVVFQVAGGCGLGALDAAKQQGKWGIGVDKDQSDLGDHILTSAVKRVDTAVFEAIKSAQEGTYQGGTDLTFDLENEGVAVGKINSKVAQEDIDQMEALEQQIIDGTIRPPKTL